MATHAKAERERAIQYSTSSPWIVYSSAHGQVAMPNRLGTCETRQVRWLVVQGGPLKRGRHGTASSKASSAEDAGAALCAAPPDAPEVADIYSNRGT
jgi:hypothetical protein